MTSKPKGRSPDFRVTAMNKTTSKGHRVGAAWIGEKGFISITLDEFVVLSGRDPVTITLFPWEDSK